MSASNIFGLLGGFAKLTFGDMFSEQLALIIGAAGFVLVLIPLIVIWFTGNQQLRDAADTLGDG